MVSTLTLPSPFSFFVISHPIHRLLDFFYLLQQSVHPNWEKKKSSITKPGHQDLFLALFLLCFYSVSVPPPLFYISFCFLLPFHCGRCPHCDDDEGEAELIPLPHLLALCPSWVSVCSFISRWIETRWTHEIGANSQVLSSTQWACFAGGKA